MAHGELDEGRALEGNRAPRTTTGSSRALRRERRGPCPSRQRHQINVRGRTP